MKTISDLDKITLPTGAGGSRVSVKGNSRKRFLADSAKTSACYHVMSRTVGGELILGDTEKEAFRVLMWKMARFSGIQILTYAVMGNHFHLLVSVPNQKKFVERFEGAEGEETLFKHLKLLYSKDYLSALRYELSEYRERGLPELAEEILAKYRKRFCNLSLFVKEIKERFTRWYNKKEGRKGTLWMDRFKSVMVQDGEALETMAAYIDLNPVRAGLVKDPKDYRWSGYGEAMGGSKRARRGLCKVVGRPVDSWEEEKNSGRNKKGGGLKTCEVYRCWLFGDGYVAGQSEQIQVPKKKQLRKGFSRKEIEQVKEKGGTLSRGQLLRCRVRYFSDGLALGDQDFIETLFQEHREKFGKRREKGARPVRELEKKSALFSLRALRIEAVEQHSTDK